MYFYKKNHFLLLETLIAFTILAICALVVIRNPIFFLRSEMKKLERIEYERIAELTLCELKLLLYENRIAWNKIASKKAEAKVYPLSPTYIKLKNFPQKRLERSYQIWVKREKEGEKGTIYRIYRADIYLTPTFEKSKYQYSYRLFAQRLSSVL